MPDEITGPPLEEVVDHFIEQARANDRDEPPSLYELEEALVARIELAGGPGVDVDKLLAVATGGALETMAATGMRDELARDLTYAIHAAGEFADLDVLDRATAIAELTASYVRLGREVDRTTPLQPQPQKALLPIRTNEEVIAGVWRRLNETGRFGTATLDDVVAHLRAELEAPVTAIGEAGG